MTETPAAPSGGEPSDPGGDASGRSALDRGVDWLLRLPLSYKILLANMLLVALAVAGALLLVRRYPELQAAYPLVLISLTTALALLVGAVVNGVIVRIALRPLWELEDAATRIASGDRHARASVPAVADHRLRQLIDVFNGMLDRLAEERQRRQELAVGTLRAEERARRDVADTLHNDTAQRLATHVLRLRQIRRAESDEERDRLLEEAREEATETLEAVRRTARDLHPPALEELGLGAALRAYGRGVAGEEITLEVHAEDVEGLSDRRRSLFYRILREALSNALRHAEPETVRIDIERDDSLLRGRVVDDGRGFDVVVARRDPEIGLGLLAMEELAADLGGELEVDSATGEGTEVRVAVPVQGTEESVRNGSP